MNHAQQVYLKVKITEILVVWRSGLIYNHRGSYQIHVQMFLGFVGRELWQLLIDRCYLSLREGPKKN